jgi:SAM-dependent methyltransferase
MAATLPTGAPPGAMLDPAIRHPGPEVNMSAARFDPAAYKRTTTDQWQTAAEPWHRWGPTLEAWLGAATETMLDMAGVAPGSRVLDVAAGAGGQTLAAARRVGPGGHVLATDISGNILAFAERSAREAGVRNVETRVLDGERLDVPPRTFDAVISRVGFIPFPTSTPPSPACGARSGRAAAWRGSSPRHPRPTPSSRSRSRSSAAGRGCRRRRPAGRARSASAPPA